MSLLHYIDNEVPAFGEWDLLFQSGGSTIIQSVAAAFPERGAMGLRAVADGAAGVGYVRKDTSITVAPGGEIYIGYFLRINSYPSSGIGASLTARNGAAQPLIFDYVYSNHIRFYAANDAGLLGPFIYYFNTGRLYWVVEAWQRATTNIASDGWAKVWVGGALRKTWNNIDNFDKSDVLDDLLIGQNRNAAIDGYSLDFDEIKIATTYPEPFVPTPLTDYPEARRTVVLFRQDSSDSREFADYCVSELKIPRANLCPLPNATANETMADYATFETEVEDDLNAWLALNPTVAANCSCFLIGYGVPGYFDYFDGFYTYQLSATSRLMNLDAAFSFCTDNPLYNPATIARLTKTALGGKYLVTRIDADSLANAKLIIDRAATVSDLSAISADGILFCDDATYRASLACQHLRIITAALAEYHNDAFVWGDTGVLDFYVSGGRAVFTDDSLTSASLLRSGSAACRTAIFNEYAAALGNADGVAPVTFDAESFFEMLRIGGTLAEAFAVAIAHLDYTAVAVGSPLMTVAFQLGGYNAYRHVGGVDWDDATIVAYLRAGVSQAVLTGLGHVADQAYYYGVRAVSDSGVEETNTDKIVRVLVDSGGNLLGQPPNAITSAFAEAVAGGKIRLRAYYKASGAAAAATGVQVALVTAGVPDWASPLQTIAVARTKRINVVLNDTFADGRTVRLAVRAVTAAGVGGGARFLNPVVADSSAPADVEYAEAEQG